MKLEQTCATIAGSIQSKLGVTVSYVVQPLREDKEGSPRLITFSAVDGKSETLMALSEGMFDGELKWLVTSVYTKIKQGLDWQKRGKNA